MNDEPPTPPDEAGRLLVSLQERDEILTRYQLRYEASLALDSGAVPTWKFPQLAEVGIPDERLGPNRLEMRYDEQLIVRGDETTFVRQLDPALLDVSLEPGSRVPLVFQQWSNVGGDVREISRQHPEVSVPADTLVDVYPLDENTSQLLAFQRAEIELAHGFGLGSRIVELDSAEPADDDGWSLSGRARIGTLEADFEARLEANLLIREITVENEDGGVVARLVVTGSGTARQGDVLVSGEARIRSSMVPRFDGEEGEEILLEDRSIRFESIVADLPDAEYDELVAIEVPDGASLIRWNGDPDDDDGDDGEGDEGGGGEGGRQVPACPKCRAQWVDQTLLIGGLECEHGPEHDQSAACRRARQNRTVRCKEIVGPAGNCECFKCQGIPFRDPFSITCEDQILYWEAWCGTIKQHNLRHRCPIRVGNRGIVYQFRKARLTNRRVCDGSNGSMISVLYCGRPGGLNGSDLACQATNCQGVGAYGGSVLGRRKACI